MSLAGCGSFLCGPEVSWFQLLAGWLVHCSAFVLDGGKRDGYFGTLVLLVACIGNPSGLTCNGCAFAMTHSGLALWLLVFCCELCV